jgi:hypothetical protein
MGVKVKILSSDKAAMTRGFWAGAMIDDATGLIKGGVTRGVEGGVVAY